jgi:tetratricopeptide (TPR) repeat protein
VRPWRFDDARNAALALVPPDIDICFSLDLDELPAPGWREGIERGWTERTTRGRYRFVNTRLANGAPAVVFQGARIHVRFGYRWRHLCHEILVADRIGTEHDTWLPGVQVEHWPDFTKRRISYVTLLEAAVAEAPDDPRDILLLGRAYAATRRWDKSEATLRRFLALPAAARRLPGRAQAYRILARCRNAMGDPAGAIACLEEGVKLVPTMRDLWLDLADLHAEVGDWRSCYSAARKGLDIQIETNFISNDHRHAGGRPFYQASLAARHLGLLEESAALAVQADKLEPNHPVYQRHLRGFGPS